MKPPRVCMIGRMPQSCSPSQGSHQGLGLALCHPDVGFDRLVEVAPVGFSCVMTSILEEILWGYASIFSLQNFCPLTSAFSKFAYNHVYCGVPRVMVIFPYSFYVYYLEFFCKKEGPLLCVGLFLMSVWVQGCLSYSLGPNPKVSHLFCCFNYSSFDY